MRAIVLSIPVLLNLVNGTGAFAGAFDYADKAGIEASRAGIELREQGPSIQALVPVEEGGWKVDSLDEDRQRCIGYKSVLEQAPALFSRGDLTHAALKTLVADAKLSPICLMTVFNSLSQDSVVYSVLITPAEDFVFGYSEHSAYTSWSEIDHEKARFDTVVLDPWTILGIAPAGQSASETVQMPLPKEFVAPVPPQRPDPTPTGSIN